MIVGITRNLGASAPFKNKTMKATVTTFYSDTLVGTTGEVIKRWTDPNGFGWATLYFGKNLSGQKLKKSYPINVLDIS